LKREGNTDFVSGLISGLVAQSELSELLDKLYGSRSLVEELHRYHEPTYPNEAGEDASTSLYAEVASIFG
jgi:hypothetical protein